MASKYSEGPTRNKKASTFTATAPDGTVLKKNCFFIHTDTALMGAFKHEGKWIASGITAQVQDWGTQIFLTATRVNK